MSRLRRVLANLTEQCFFSWLEQDGWISLDDPDWAEIHERFERHRMRLSILKMLDEMGRAVDRRLEVLQAGMGGASPRGNVPPMTNIDGEVVDGRHDEIGDGRTDTTGISVSVSVSAGVGMPLYSPDEAVKRIEEGPIPIAEWWPKKKPVTAPPPTAPSSPSMLSWLPWQNQRSSHDPSKDSN